ncbi:S49 family peptidase [Capnocytophaga sp. ARDL2]|uniref:S49 family peptidase n=1 Tax=Capnocytophaga sp. ARDL2 TaxID=3238809 RepID=UPI00355814B0
MIGNTFINTPLAIEQSYLMALIPTLLSEYALAQRTMSISAEEKEQKYLSTIQAMNTRAEGAMYPVVISIVGPIMKYSSWACLGTSFYIDLLKSLDSNPQVLGIILNIDSGGGMVSGTAELTDTIKNLSKPTIAYTSGYMCSAALDIASGCDHIMASPYADLIGSIGTMLSYADYQAMLEKWGAKFYELYAPQSTEKNKEWRELMKGNEALYTERLEELAQSFIDRMKENFGEKLTDDGKVFKGKTYTPKQALEIGLIDQLGSIEDAMNLL